MIFAKPDFFYYRDEEENRSLYKCLREHQNFESSDIEYKECVYRVNSLVFQTFVLMQIFNEISCRRIKSNEFCIFESFFNNWRFIVIMIVTIIVQVALVQSGLPGINARPINFHQHMVALMLGANVITWALLCKFLVPEKLFRFLKMDERPMTNREIEKSRLSFLRHTKKFTHKNRRLLYHSGLKSFTYNKKSTLNPARMSTPKKTFKKGLYTSLMVKH